MNRILQDEHEFLVNDFLEHLAAFVRYLEGSGSCRLDGLAGLRSQDADKICLTNLTRLAVVQKSC